MCVTGGTLTLPESSKHVLMAVLGPCECIHKPYGKQSAIVQFLPTLNTINPPNQVGFLLLLAVGLEEYFNFIR